MELIVTINGETTTQAGGTLTVTKIIDGDYSYEATVKIDGTILSQSRGSGSTGNIAYSRSHGPGACKRTSCSLSIWSSLFEPTQAASFIVIQRRAPTPALLPWRALSHPQPLL
ncbi:MAG: hypothetical protein GFH27_549307n200 [Chloroflexi bacterium AL-W]|nr:hypothetical protein [Chloroflexi bacterium AL-N1]NOK69232.1 hypothetical protein [Chloroflexi bacterium AL-N10]NOK77215.1 hypothetical protein [Chloroflexi bacterium AL-N5]NOK83860.1 hypothetical protein [Chloroflexi bacterium AL-W]NOK91070.1 hypothetical protein [Chloroflexi bacterium AL-N15]